MSSNNPPEMLQAVSDEIVQQQDANQLIMDFDAGMPIYGINFSNKKHAIDGGTLDESVFIGLTSCIPPNNVIMLLEMSETEKCIQKVAQIEEYYPCTKIQWIPRNEEYTDDVFATSSDSLRLYKPGVN